MKWLRDNLVGMALLGAMAVLLLVSFALVVMWAWPVSGEIPAQTAEDLDAAAAVVVVSEIGPVSDYLVINERPVFSTSRQPEVVEAEAPVEVVQEAPKVKDKPEVKLTGVFISPSTRIASLMSLQGEQVTVTAKEGEPLVGDYVGWQVSKVQPRHVVLTSRDGQTFKLELKVHDVKIAEPPKMELPPAADADLVADDQEDVAVGEDGEPLSRAEQIRARIAERREQLRQQQEGKSDGQAKNNGQTKRDGEAKKAEPPLDYQSAIRAMINKTSKDNISNDEKDS